MSMSEVSTVRDDAKATRLNDLNDLWWAINALGGEPNTDFERGVHNTVARALSIIEDKQAEVRRGA